MIYVRITPEGFREIRHSSFRNDLDPGWETRWRADSNVKAYLTMDEVDKAIDPSGLTVSDTWAIAGWAAKKVLVWEMTEDMRFTGEEAVQRADDFERAKDGRFTELQRQLVAAISELERAGHLNVLSIENALKAIKS